MPPIKITGISLSGVDVAKTSEYAYTGGGEKLQFAQFQTWATATFRFSVDITNNPSFFTDGGEVRIHAASTIPASDSLLYGDYDTISRMLANIGIVSFTNTDTITYGAGKSILVGADTLPDDPNTSTEIMNSTKMIEHTSNTAFAFSKSSFIINATKASPTLFVIRIIVVYSDDTIADDRTTDSNLTVNVDEKRLAGSPEITYTAL